jgi:tRNA nucleotidyltransferase/poly(A) polymerase
MATPRAWALLKLMDDDGLLEKIFPELAPLKHCSQNAYHQYDVFEHTLKAFDFLEKLLHAPAPLSPEIESLRPFLPPAAHFPMLKFAILLHDIGKPWARSTDDAGRIHFYGHEQQSADMAKTITRRLRFSNNDQDYVDFIIRHHIRPLSLFIADRRNNLSPKTLTRFFMKSGSLTRDLLVHTTADIYGKGIPENKRAFIEFILKILLIHEKNFLPRKSLPPLVTGMDLIQEFELTPSPQFSEILARIEEERLSGIIRTRSQALDEIKKMLRPE